MDFSLSMVFINTNGDKVPLTISGVKGDITQVEVSALMDTIIAKDVFLNKGGSLVSKYSAQLTERQTTKFEVQ
jgi:hypothetical protein